VVGGEPISDLVVLKEEDCEEVRNRDIFFERFAR